MLLHMRHAEMVDSIAVGFGISVGTAHAFAAAVVDLLALRLPCPAVPTS